jgi:hypothetical protein
MAILDTAIGTSHSPMLLTSPRLWLERAEQDRGNPALYDPTGRHTTYAALEAQVGDRFRDEMDTDRWERRFRLCQDSMDRLAADLAERRPDLLIVVGDDQKEVFASTNQPAIGVFWGERWHTGTMEDAPPGAFFDAVKTGYAMDDRHEFAGDAKLARGIIEHLVASGFDIASLDATPPGHGFGHAYGFVIRRLLGEREIPVVPILLNTYDPPNQPTPSRCYDFGRALAEAIGAAGGQARVALVASGGLSHFVVDEEIDSALLDAISSGDEDALRKLPAERLQSGSSEIRNWIAVAGAMAGRPVAWSQYAPCYRTPAGTGCGMGFLRWAS